MRKVKCSRMTDKQKQKLQHFNTVRNKMNENRARKEKGHDRNPHNER